MFLRMNLDRVIDHIAGRADELLQGVKTRAEARLAVADWLDRHEPQIEGSARSNVLDGVMTVLEDEAFFERRFTDTFESDRDTGIVED